MRCSKVFDKSWPDLTAQLAGAPIVGVFREALPFALALIAVLALIAFVPALALWPPEILMGP